MWTPQWGQPVIILLLLILVPARVVGSDSPVMQRLRTDSPYVRVVIASGIERSPSFRAIVDQLERSDLIVEVQCTRLNDSRLAGRTVFLSAQPAVRYVLVEVECPAMLRIVAHELSHALEIATARSVVDSETLAQLYAQIGFRTYRPSAATCGDSGRTRCGRARPSRAVAPRQAHPPSSPYSH